MADDKDKNEIGAVPGAAAATVPATAATPATPPARPAVIVDETDDTVTADDLKPLTEDDIKKLQTGEAGTSVSHFERTGPSEAPELDKELVQQSMSNRDLQLKHRRGLRSPAELAGAAKK